MNIAELPSARPISLILGEGPDALAVELYYRRQLGWANSARTDRTKAIRLAMIADLALPLESATSQAQWLAELEQLNGSDSTTYSKTIITPRGRA